jgi:tRNA 2-thiocytidine biosynthesis protein TtcA
MTPNLETRLTRSLLNANQDYELISPGDSILLAFSGEKDSFCLFQLLNKIFIEDISFNPPLTIYPVFIDLGFSSPTWDKDVSNAREYLAKFGSTLIIEKTDIFMRSHQPENTKNPCFLCARMRRKRLYEMSEKLNCHKIAMAHHKDDIIETLLMNIFFSREINTMVPRQKTFGGRFEIIKPLAFAEERLLQQYAWENTFPVIENPCAERLKSKRRFIKDLLLRLEKEEPKLKNNIFLSLKNVKRNFLL